MAVTQGIHQFDRAIEMAGLVAQREALLARARECVYLFYGKPVDTIGLGKSRIGGTPDLPASVEWPAGVKNGLPHGKATFLAQINLADLPEADVGLPRHGHLWLFILEDGLIRPPVSVFYRDGSEPLVPHDTPGGAYAEPLTPLTFAPGLSLPFSWKHFEADCGRLGITQDQLQKLMDAFGDLDSYGARDGHDGQIGGYSFQCEIDLSRFLAFEWLGRPECMDADYWKDLNEFDKSLDNVLPFRGVSESQRQAERERLMAKRDNVAWIDQNEARVAETAASVHLLCMFRPGRSLELGSGMFLDFLIRKEARDQLDFSGVKCWLPMLL